MFDSVCIAALDTVSLEPVTFDFTDHRVGFEQLFDAYYEDCRRYAFSIVNNWPEAEEMAQDSYLALWNNLDRYAARPAMQWKPLLMRMVYNKALNLLERRKTKQRYVDAVKADFSHWQSHHFQSDFELEARLYQAVADLPPQCQRVFQLSRMQGLSQKEIADELGISRKTIENHMTKALRHMRIVFKDLLGVACLVWATSLLDMLYETV